MSRHRQPTPRGLDEARATLTHVAASAARGEPTTLTRRGRAIAEVVPVGTWERAHPPVHIGVDPGAGPARSVEVLVERGADGSARVVDSE